MLAFERGGGGRNTLLDPRKCTFNLGDGGGGSGRQGSSITPSKSSLGNSMTRFIGGTKTEVDHKWAGSLHNPYRLGGPQRFTARDKNLSGPQVDPMAT